MPDNCNHPRPIRLGPLSEAVAAHMRGTPTPKAAPLFDPNSRSSIEKALRSLSEADCVYVAQHARSNAIQWGAHDEVVRRRQEAAAAAQRRVVAESQGQAEAAALESMRKMVRRDMKSAKRAGNTAEIARLNKAGAAIREFVDTRARAGQITESGATVLGQKQMTALVADLKAILGDDTAQYHSFTGGAFGPTNII